MIYIKSRNMIYIIGRIRDLFLLLLMGACMPFIYLSVKLLELEKWPPYLDTSEKTTAE